MSYKFILLSTLIIFVLGAGSLLAGEHPEHSVEQENMTVIALKTDDFELAETDVSHLGIGDAETIYTQSGKTIDLLRTAEGIEIYVDGELLETGMEGEDGVHERHHIVHKRVEVECNSDEECEELVWITDDEDMDMESIHGEEHHEKIIIIKEKAESN